MTPSEISALLACIVLIIVGYKDYTDAIECDGALDEAKEIINKPK